MLDTSKAPIILLLGPSGSGKTTLGDWLAEDLQILHLEIDRWPDGDGIDLEGLRTEWDAFVGTGQAARLAAVIRDRVRRVGRQGAVLSFPSILVLSPALIRTAEQQGIRPFVLYGTGAECLDAFLERERKTGRRLGQKHWIQYNAYSYIAYSQEEFARHRLGTFASGERRQRADLVAEVKKKLAN